MPSGTCGYQSRRGKDAYRCRYHPLLLLARNCGNMGSDTISIATFSAVGKSPRW